MLSDPSLSMMATCHWGPATVFFRHILLARVELTTFSLAWMWASGLACMAAFTLIRYWNGSSGTFCVEGGGEGGKGRSDRNSSSESSKEKEGVLVVSVVVKLLLLLVLDTMKEVMED